MSLSNADLDALSAKDFYKEFRLIWKGKETKLTEDVSMFSLGRGRCTLMIISAIHGNERGGAQAIYKFAKWLNNHKINGKIIVHPVDPHTR